MPKIIRFHETGGADALKIEDLPLTEPGEGEVRLKVEAIGLNRAEVMFRQGHYLEDPELPSRIGYEAAGTVDAVGPGVSGIQIGDRVSTLCPAFRWEDMESTAKVRLSRPTPWPVTPRIYRQPKALQSGCST